MEPGEGGRLRQLSVLFQAAAAEYEAAGGLADNSEDNCVPSSSSGRDGGEEFCLSASLLSEIHDFFQSLDTNHGGAASAELEGLWDELAEKKISAGGIVRVLRQTMESRRGRAGAGLKAAFVYLSLLLVPNWPVYSLFSQMAFDSLARCLRSTGRSSTSTTPATADDAAEGGQGGGVVGGGAVERRKKGQQQPRKGKRGREKKDKDVQEEAMMGDADEDDAIDGQGGGSSSADAVVSLEKMSSLLSKLQRVVVVLQLRERQETLKLIVALLVDMLHVLSDMGEDERERARGEVAGRGKRRAAAAAGGGGDGGAPAASSVPDIVFLTLQSLLGAMHGEPLTTAILILRALTPTILLTHPSSGGSSSSSSSCKVEIRNRTMQFITHTMMLGPAEESARQVAVAALPRYLCFKAPDKTDGRSLAVDCVVAIIKAAPNCSEWCRFSNFVMKLSHSKPRHRLVATDVSLALLGALPSPLRRAALPNDMGSDFSSSTSSGSPHESYRRQSGNNNGGCQEGSGGSGDRTENPFGIEDVEAGAQDAGAHDRAGSSSSSQERGQQSSWGGDDPPTPENQWWGITCFEILLHRSSDKVPAIRSRALGNLAQAIELLSADVTSRRHIQSLLGLNNNSNNHGGAAAAGGPTAAGILKSRLFSACDTPVIGGDTPSPEPNSSDLPGATPLTPGAGHRDLWSLLQRRCLDDKAAVRKASFLAMKKSTVLLGKGPEEGLLNAMGTACGDAMISIRKAALSALSEVMKKFPGDSKVAREWLKSALPLAFDNEQSMQDECLGLFEELVLDRITLISSCLSLPRRGGSRLHPSSSSSAGSGDAAATALQEKDLERLLPVGVMSLLKEMADGSSVSSCVKRICCRLGKAKRIRPGVALALQSLISAHRCPDGAWFLLSEVSAFVPKAVGWDFLRTHWKLLDSRDGTNDTRQRQEQQQQLRTEPVDGGNPCGNLATWAVNRVHLLQTISNVAVELPPDAAAELASELLDRLKAFNMHPAEVGAHIKALAVLCRRKAVSTDEGDRVVIVWVKGLLEQAADILQAFLSPSISGSCNAANATPATPVLVTPKATRKGGSSSANEGTQTRSKSRSKFSASFSNHNKGNERSGRQAESAATPQIVTVIFTIGDLALTCPQVKAHRVVTLLQTLLTPAKGLLRHRKNHGAAGDTTILLKEKITPEINIHLRVALGKLCLADEDLAKRCIPLFVQELRTANSASLRNNTMIIMADFCVRYTALIDEYTHDLTRSLQDSCELVRRQTFVLLSRLLQRDYVKWRGTLFHRFLLAVVDDSEKVRQLATYVFGSVLKTKAPLLAYNSFVEAIFVLNDCVSQASSSSLLQIPEHERALFCLRGDAESVVDKRMKIYSTLLQQMVPEHLLATSAKLCAEILAAAADALLDLNDGPSQCVLQDALRILASKELRITGTRAAAAGNAELEEEDAGAAAAAIAAVKGRVVTQLMKKNLVQNAVPIFIELKRLLESRNSPMLGLLMECIRVMLKDYKNEIEEILVADKQLQKEILYDMQKHEAAKARAKVAAAASAIPIHREVLQQVAPSQAAPGSNLRNHPPSGSAAKSKSASAMVDDDEAQQQPQQARRTTRRTGKENEVPSASLLSVSSLPAPSATTRSAGKQQRADNILRTPSFPLSAQKKSAVGNFLSGDPHRHQYPMSSSSSPRTAGTPRIRTYSAAAPGPSSLSRLLQQQQSQSRDLPLAQTPPLGRGGSTIISSSSRRNFHFRHQQQQHQQAGARVGGVARSPAAGGLHPAPAAAADASSLEEDDSHCDSQEETRLAGAVAEVAAVTTVANVLQQVAQKSVTPLKEMSIPRLRQRHGLSGLSSLRARETVVTSSTTTTCRVEILQAGDRPPGPSPSSVHPGGIDLETVRRRQSFSEVDEPCGLSSQSDD